MAKKIFGGGVCRRGRILREGGGARQVGAGKLRPFKVEGGESHP